MSKFISLAFAAFAAASVFASGDTPKSWYNPSSWSKNPNQVVDFTFNGKSYNAFLADDGTILWNPGGGYPSSLNAAKTSVEALTQAFLAQKQVETLADTMHGIFVTDGLTMTGKDANGNAISYKIKFKKDADGKIAKDGGSIEAETEATFNNLPDNATIQWTPSGKAHLQLYGKPTNAADGDGKFPMFNGSTLTWAALKPYFDTKCFTVETVSNARIKDEGIHLHGWKDKEKTGSDFEIATVMTDKRDYSGCYSLVYNGGSLQYWKFGKLDKGGSVKVDGASVVTNETEDGSASIKGFMNAEMEQLPYTDGESMKWTSGGSVNGSLLARGALIPGSVGWTSTQSGNYYYGTTKSGGDLGWHELPNTTTNAVEADDATLKSTIKENDVKELSLYSAPGGDGRLYGAFMADGKLGWAAVAETTNAQYGVDAVSIDTNGVGGVLQIAGFKDKLGTGFLTKFGGKVISASMSFTNGLTRTETADGDYNRKIDVGLENWDTPSGTCAENLGGILSGQIQEADGDHCVLTRYKDGNLHYTKIGRVPSAPADGVTITTNNPGTAANKLAIAGAYSSENANKFLKSTGSGTEWADGVGGSPVDNASITTNANEGAITQGSCSLYGWNTAGDGKVPKKSGNALVWEDVGRPDDTTLDIKTEGSGTSQTKELRIKGFDTASNMSVPFKDENGNFTWLESTSSTRLVAGAGINITENGNIVTISAEELEEDPTGTTVTINVVTSIRYDEENHRFEIKKRRITFNGTAEAEPEEWTEIFTAISHKSEHED